MRIRNLLFLMIFMAASVLARGVDFQLDGVTLPKSVTLVYSQVFQRSFMLAPDVIADNRLISFHITENLDAHEFFTRYLNNMGIGVSSKNGVDYIYKLPVTDKPAIPKKSYVYQPRYRSVAYLVSVLTNIVPDGKFGSDSRAATVTATPTLQGGLNAPTSGDVLVFTVRLRIFSDYSRLFHLLIRLPRRFMSVATFMRFRPRNATVLAWPLRPDC
ncbi:hypothetical protein [Dickeya dadantii]|uniref:hypothetical protein n=1 Tax=Dickeya dadantii TaxID=204038 RepID=UPI0021DAD884|nr:hypothetical protein [Dickeya dadantii]